ncbi:hypothetical protein C7212DRAFT_357481 [Tuber magnatum]|uniref:Smr domain-containing protein n=1 Tax=Tuber magnatum TaxID=42249 RepID=A0A317SP22_9PEZI|nr:hypothetical protein C7212DRAFT_357481 [Tuber magnatum]
MSDSDSPQSEDDCMATYDRAEARHISFTDSYEAYASGDRALAHTLSQQGKRHGENMKAYNEQAKNFIFSINNAGLPRNTVDLHGLYVEEAMDVLRCRMADIRRGGMWVIVGKGNHSVGKARLGPAIERYCGVIGVKVDQRVEEGRLYLH